MDSLVKNPISIARDRRVPDRRPASYIGSSCKSSSRRPAFRWKNFDPQGEGFLVETAWNQFRLANACNGALSGKGRKKGDRLRKKPLRMTAIEKNWRGGYM